jgi:hypothetical protein
MSTYSCCFNKNVKNVFFINVWRTIIFDIYFTEFGAAFDNCLTVLFKYCYTYCYSDSDKISQQMENCENRNDPDLVQVFLKKCWVESDFKAPKLPLSLRLKISGCHYNSMYNNTWTKQLNSCPDRVKRKTTKLVFVASPLSTHQ